MNKRQQKETWKASGTGEPEQQSSTAGVAVAAPESGETDKRFIRVVTNQHYMDEKFKQIEQLGKRVNTLKSMLHNPELTILVMLDLMEEGYKQPRKTEASSSPEVNPKQEEFKYALDEVDAHGKTLIRL